MEEKSIEVVKTWLEPKSVRDIQVFLGFTHFYQRFIKRFSRITASLTSMLRTTENSSFTDVENLREAGGSIECKIVCDAKIGSESRRLNNKSKIIDNLIGTIFFTPEARTTFTILRTVFTKAPILYRFDLKRYIQIENNVFGFAISTMLSQLTSSHVILTHPNQNPLSKIGQWHPIVCFSQKIIRTETWYKTHDKKVLAIVEAFKT